MIQPSIFEPFPWIASGQSTREAGVSPEPYYSLNLGAFVGDNLDNVLENRRRFLKSLGFRPDQLAASLQVHGQNILIVLSPGAFEGYDSLVTNKEGIVVAVSIADCVPILLADIRNRVVAAVHAGWKGTAGGIVHKTLHAMKNQFDTNPKEVFAFIGVCIDECSYEVDADVADHFDKAFKRWDADAGKFFIDLKKANRHQLLEFGIPTDQIEVSSYSTVRDNSLFFSHRHEKGKTGRMLAAIAIR